MKAVYFLPLTLSLFIGCTPQETTTKKPGLTYNQSENCGEIKVIFSSSICDGIYDISEYTNGCTRLVRNWGFQYSRDAAVNFAIRNGVKRKNIVFDNSCGYPEV